MGMLPIFDADERPAQAARLAPKLRRLAEEGIYFGTSSWKYEGWIGSIYDSERYVTRGKFSTKKFEFECLAEYAETFPVVCGDFAFYQFPSPEYWKRLFGETPASFLFALKVPEDITLTRWPRHARYGKRAGSDNPAFLNEKLLETLFTRRLEPYASRVAALIFEFGTFAKSSFPTVHDFLSRLDGFLAELPPGFRYAIEIRNSEYLQPSYFALLASHNVAHVYNAWTRMPELSSQVDLNEANTADFAVARALLPRGKSYEQAVAALAPYEELREANPSARDGLRRIAEAARTSRKPAFLFVNNRLEGHAPTTIEAVADALFA